MDKKFKRYGLYGHKAKNYKFNEEEIFMNTIYTPTGRAAEYCELALNIYNGCDHGCLYCYVPQIMHKTREDFNEVFPRKNILTEVRKIVHKYRGKKVLLSFASDPYPAIEKEYELTRKILQLFIVAKIIPVILTKSNYADRDFDILKEAGGIYGATLTFIKEGTHKWEPGAAVPQQRLLNLKKAHEMGIKTWVSLEPVIKPSETLELIDISHEYVDEYKIGKLNYLPEAKEINWNWFLQMVIDRLKKYNKKFYIKKDLWEYRNKK